MSQKKIIEILKEKGIYEESDNILIKELFYNISLMRESKKDIRERGLINNLTTNQDKAPYWQQNNSLSIYNNALKNVLTICSKLGLSPKDRANLKILETKTNDDGFDNI